MVPHPMTANPRCMNSLLRYELAAVRCYRFAELVFDPGPERDALTELRADHEASADGLRAALTAAGQVPDCDPGAWGVLVTLAETAAAVFGRRELLTVLGWGERHAADTYAAAGESAPGFPGDRPAALRGHERSLRALADALGSAVGRPPVSPWAGCGC